MEPVGRIKHDAVLIGEFSRWRYQLDVRQLQRSVEFVRMRHLHGEKSAVYDCLVLCT